MSQNFLQLNKEKTEILIIGANAQREYLSLKSKHQVTNLGVIMDADLNFEAHVRDVTKSAFYHLKNIAKVQGFISQSDSEKLVHAFINSRLD